MSTSQTQQQPAGISADPQTIGPGHQVELETHSNVLPVETVNGHLNPQEPGLEEPDSSANDRETPAAKLEPRLFAVVIGINKYRKPGPESGFQNLRGAISDAKHMVQFLRTDGPHWHSAPFGPVPEDRIVTLLDHEATRERIMDELRLLAQRSSIGPQDPILIYYAGHGSIAPAPTHWGDGWTKRIEMIVPHDFIRDRSASDSESTIGAGIHDFEISEILTQIAERKSDNITVILDCCHSGSGTRNGDSENARGFDLPSDYRIPNSIQPRDDSGSRDMLSDPKSRYQGLKSHVLLAGCKKEETTRETAEGEPAQYGYFTHNLLKVLCRYGLSFLTYQATILGLPDVMLDTKGNIIHQHPQCEGFNQNRILFTTKTAAQRSYLVEPPSSYHHDLMAGSKSPPICIITAGDVDGITTGAEFQIYADHKLAEPLGTVVAHVVLEGNRRTICTLPVGSDLQLSSNTDSLRAVLLRVGTSRLVSVFIHNEAEFGPLIRKIQEKTSSSNRDPELQYLRMTHNLDDKPDFRLSLKTLECGQHVVKFKIRDENYEESYAPLSHDDNITSENPERILNILSSATRFLFYLRHETQDTSVDNTELSKNITLEMYKLKNVSKIKQTWEAGELVGRDGDGCLYINVDEKDPALKLQSSQGFRYGFKITNDNDLPMYVALFYFDVPSLRIRQFLTYSTARVSNGDGAIPPYSHLTVGYGPYLAGNGSKESRPLIFGIDDKDLDVNPGFIKLYMSNESIGLSVAQNSPFTSDRELVVADLLDVPLIWSTKTISILQMRESAFNRDRGKTTNA